MKRIRELDGAKIDNIIVRNAAQTHMKQMFIYTNIGVMALSVKDYDYVIFTEEEETDEKPEELGDSNTNPDPCDNPSCCKPEGRSPEQGP